MSGVRTRGDREGDKAKNVFKIFKSLQLKINFKDDHGIKKLLIQ
jgi:hypothetical protein